MKPKVGRSRRPTEKQERVVEEETLLVSNTDTSRRRSRWGRD